jgi:hypothetical protein
VEKPIADGSWNQGCLACDGLQKDPACVSWQELTDAVVRDWPGRPDPLDERALLRRFEELAAQVPGLSPSLRRQVVEDAPGVLLLAFRHFQRSRPFTPWARQVLRCHAISLYRRTRRVLADSDRVRALAAPTSLAEEVLAEVLHDFRQLGDVVRFPLRTENGPELAAVFALEARLRLLAELVRYGPDFLDSHLPLRGWEQALRIRRDWPTLGELWALLRAEAEPRLRHVEAVRRACQQLVPAVEGVHKVWGTWVNRARECVSRQLESHAQARLFFHLFPGYRSARSDAGLKGWAAGRQVS